MGKLTIKTLHHFEIADVDWGFVELFHQWHIDNHVSASPQKGCEPNLALDVFAFPNNHGLFNIWAEYDSINACKALSWLERHNIRESI